MPPRERLVEPAEEAQEVDLDLDFDLDAEEPSTSTKVREEVRQFFLDIADALKSPREECPEVEDGFDALSVLSLQKDLRRCYALLHPIIEVLAAFYDILLWKDPVTTLLYTLVFFYSVFRQWTAMLILKLLLLQFGLNYLRAHKGIEVGLYFLPRKNVPKPKFDVSGAQLVLEVARFAQFMLRFTVNVLEKIHSLFTWKEERVTRRFCYLLIYWLAWATLFDMGTCVSWCLAAFGVRIFITTFLFERFPRLRRSLDTYGWFYRNLPNRSRAGSSSSTSSSSSLEDDDKPLSRTTSTSSVKSGNSLRNIKAKARFHLWQQPKQFLRKTSRTG